MLICVVRDWIVLQHMCPRKFAISPENTFPTWRGGTSIISAAIAALPRSAAYESGVNPGAYSLQSLRAGGATALYQETRDVELVARLGRWRAKSISAYLWGSRPTQAGVGELMVANTHTLHMATNRHGKKERTPP